MADKPSTLKLKVNLDCKCCYKKIQKILCKIQVEERITAISYDDKNNTVTISGPFCPQKLKQKLHCKAGKLILEITIVTSTTITTISPPPPPKPMEVNVNVKFDPPPKPSCGGGCCSKPSCGGCCCSKPSCGGCCCSKPSCGGCCCSKPSCGGSSCNCRIIPCRGYYPPSCGLPPFFQFTIEDI